VSDLFEDQKSVLKDCTDRFTLLGIPYMLTGSMAMATYAMMRMTNDIDIVVELKAADASRIITAFEPEYYVPRERVHDAISRQGMFNLLHKSMIVKVDCVIRKDDEFQQTVFSRRELRLFAGMNLWVISKDDLILSKMNWARETRSEIQIRDVSNILRNGFDESYVKAWVAKLELTDIFDECTMYLEKNNAD